MKKFMLCSMVLLCGTWAYAQERDLKLPKIELRPQAGNFSGMCKYKIQADLPSVEKLTAPSFKDWNADFRSCDLSQMDLSMYPSNLADYIDYDSKTKWPAKDKMPVGFNPKKYLKEGRNPGLHVRDLHRRGIDGRGVSIAIIDQPLLTTHQEYKKNLKLYESFEPSFREASLHGPAVASIAGGKTVGVAPKADLFYIAGRFESAPQEKERFNALPIAHALERIIEINNALPPAKRIRVVSISRGFCLDEKECGKYTDLGAKEFREAVNLLNKKGVAVFTTNDLFTVSRSGAQADADDNNSYTRGAYWWPDKELPGYAQWDILLFPTDFRVTAAPNGNKDYVAYANGGMSWAVPYVAGLYALGVQVYPDLTPELFWQLLKETAVQTPPLQGKNGPTTVRGKYLVQPVAFIEKLENMKALGNELLAAVLQNDKKGVASLLEQKVDSEIREDAGNTPLMLSIVQNHLDIARLLIQAGADPNARNKSGVSALFMACNMGLTDGVSVLLDAKANPNDDDRHQTALTQTILYAAQGNRANAARIVDLLLRAGANPNGSNQAGHTPLMIACSEGYTEMVKSLLAAGADPNLGEIPHNPLQLAQEKNYTEIVQLLRQYGAVDKSK